MRTQHREKKFVCDVCGHSFPYRSVLNKHLAFHKRTGNDKFGKRNYRNSNAAGDNATKADKEESQESNLQADKCTDVDFLINLSTVGNATIAPAETLTEEQSISSAVDGTVAVSELIEPRTDAVADPSLLTAIYDANTTAIIIRCATCFHEFTTQTELLRHRKQVCQAYVKSEFSLFDFTKINAYFIF